MIGRIAQYLYPSLQINHFNLEQIKVHNKT